jgi:hypothetical protein
VPSPRLQSDRAFTLLLTTLLTAYVLLVHGYHPYSEDGGVYLAGIERLLNPHLFPAYTPFVIEHLRFSLFAPLVATIVRLTHLPLPWTLLLLYLASIWLTLYAAWLLIVQATASRPARAGAVTLLAIGITLPIAGTSLYLTDPYLTARSLTTPLALFALVFTLRRRPIPCALTLLAAAALHPLMAAYALAAVLLLLSQSSVPHSSRPHRDEWVHLKPVLALASIALLTAATLQLTAPPESPTYLRIVLTRYYWFPFWWHWYEQLGLIAPLLVLYALGRRAPASTQLLTRTALALAAIALLVATAFARVHLQTHLVARLQPLRAFQTVYELLILLLGAWLGERLLRTHLTRWAILLLILPPLMFRVARTTYPASPHLELPWTPPTNSWVQAFHWIRQNTPQDAVFALDAHYITQPGEDAQGFRAIAQRSALPDYSKDGGEAAITPSLTAAWTAAQQPQTNLDAQSDAQRQAALEPLGATWIVLARSTLTHFPCPYANHEIEVCRLP